jgi:hypothetical protein
LAAPDNGADRRYTGECSQTPLTGDGCGKKTSAEEKDYDPGLEEGDHLSHTFVYPFYENPPHRGRKRALAVDWQYDIEDSAFAKMIEAKRRVEEVPPPRGSRRGRIKQI